MQPKPKRNHHIVPKLYLKGFVIKQGDPFIWVYRRGAPFNPGSDKFTHNPHLDSIKSAGVERDFYAEPKRGGGMDFDKFENILESFEKPSNPIFEKIRARQKITADEKKQFSFYVIQMLRRVPKFAKNVEKDLPPLLAKLSHSPELLQRIPGPDSDDKRARIKAVLKIIAKDPHLSKQMHLKVMSLADNSLLIPYIQNMSWRFFVAPVGSCFVTCDNPVFFFESMGLNKPDSEVSFPISSQIAMFGSWHHNKGEGYEPVKSSIVKEINRRTISNATQHVYSCHDAEWIVDLLQKQDHRFNLIW